MGFGRFLMHSFFLMRRPMTLGVRALVINQDNQILLVRHTYVPGWHLPGGGVETPETAEQALRKELEEEGGITLHGRPELVGIYKNEYASRRDHVILYMCREFEWSALREPDYEIAEIGFFSMDQLPEATVSSVRRRLNEVLKGKELSSYW